MDWWISAATAFVVIAPVELPDKTFVATLVLTTRYRPLPVWLGVASAFAVHTTVAVAAGGLLGLLPALPVRLAAAGLFAAGAVLLLRAARRGDDPEEEQQEYAAKLSRPRLGRRRPSLHRPTGTARSRSLAQPARRPAHNGSLLSAFGASFLLLFTAEWGDLSQLFTAGLVASGEPPVAVFVGAWAALAAVSGAAVLVGRWLVRRVRLSVVQYLAATVCAGLAVLTAISAFQ